jgi:S-adenosylmethionine synthetase
VGKLYNILAQRIAGALVDGIDAAEEACCYLVSQIGRPIDQPQIADVKVRVKDAASLESLRPHIAEITRAHLQQAGTLWREVIEASAPLW